MRTLQEVRDAFTPTNKLSPTQGMRLAKLQNSIMECAEAMIEFVPDSANRTAALRKLLEAKFTCVQEITHSKELGYESSQTTKVEKPVGPLDNNEKAAAQKKADEARGSGQKLAEGDVNNRNIKLADKENQAST